MKPYIIYTYLVGLVSFLIVDVAWVGLIAKDFYWERLGHILVDRADMLPALILYSGLVAGNLGFTALPGIHANSLAVTLKRAAAFGLLTYGTYDLTNQALTIDWPWIVTVVDMIWGASVNCIIGTVMFFSGRTFKNRHNAE